MTTVYILTNSAMPGLVKIGRTEAPIADRMRQLDTTGVPLPFECFLAAEVANPVACERALHEAFGDHRERLSREFFRISPDKPAAVLRLVMQRDVTPRYDVVEEEADRTALERARARRSNFTFDAAGVPVGSLLQSVFDENITCIVGDNRRVLFRGELQSLSRSALTVAHEKGFQWRAIQGPSYWKFEDIILSERRNLGEAEDDD